ncbi:MAG: YfiR family protein [Desulfobacterales bacterium]|nr:YfiR family protein [Desulfobacterales bacterium]
MEGWKKSVFFIFIIVISLCASKICFSQFAASEDQIKATLIYKFMSYIEWPSDSDPDSLSLCILGDNPFNGIFDTFIGKTVQNKKFNVQKLADIYDASQCNILFISSSEKEHLPLIFDYIKDKPILTISEVEEFCRFGGMINFIHKDGTIGFEIAPDTANKAGIKISSHLLRLAKIIK